MDIIIVAQYFGDIEHIERTNGRFSYLAHLLKKRGHEVEVITTTFFHGTKKQFKRVPKQYEGYKITTLYEPGYASNVSLRRFYSHYILAQNIIKYLNNRKHPDIAYVAVPSLSVAEAVAKWCEKNHIRLVIDIQDLWPEAFKMVLRVPILNDIVIFPMKLQANRIYSLADDIIAVSQTYADRGMDKNLKCKKAEVVYLGTEKKCLINALKR